MANNSNKIFPLILKSLDSAAFTGNYQVFDTAGLAHSCVILRIVNNSNKDITVSWNGVDDHDFVPAGKELNLSFQANSLPSGHVAQIGMKTKVYIKGAAGAGFAYLTGYFVI